MGESGMKFYFAGSISGGRDDAPLYAKLIGYLQTFGEVLTEHIGDASLTSAGEKQSDQTIYDQDMAWLFEADVLIAEVTTPSLGVGYEIGRAVAKGKQVLCLFRPRAGLRLSAMIAGCPDVTVKAYQEFEEAKLHIDAFIQAT